MTLDACHGCLQADNRKDDTQKGNRYRPHPHGTSSEKNCQKIEISSDIQNTGSESELYRNESNTDNIVKSKTTKSKMKKFDEKRERGPIPKLY
uniref:Uncharacterized protein n=1 Tax=Romanomermis culicivorax TaxID=13658 RepID=A0A915IYP8_ROMCU